MSISELIAEVLGLQSEWSSLNTPPMERRGQIVRHELPDEMHALLRSAALELDTSGRDATGRKTEIPWSRAFDGHHSPGATQGFYVVYLFDAFGSQCVLSLNQGTTDFVAGEYQPKSPELLADRVRWARDTVGRAGFTTDPYSDDIRLPTRGSNLGAQYEQGNIFSRTYEVDGISTDDELARDLVLFGRMLNAIYDHERLDPPPGAPSPELLHALNASHEAAQDRRRLSGRRSRNGRWPSRQAISKARGGLSRMSVRQSRSISFASDREHRTSWLR